MRKNTRHTVVLHGILSEMVCFSIKRRNLAAFAALLFLLNMSGKCVADGVDLTEKGKGLFHFKTQAGQSLAVWYHRPARFSTQSKFVFVMHGMNRDAERYRDAWSEYAEKFDFLLLVPEFSAKQYPGSQSYNLGNTHGRDGVALDKSKHAFTVIEDLFDYTRNKLGSRVSKYNIYGHSAGAQFVHRFILFRPDARIDTAIAANAGWYTMPSTRYHFPYGLENSGIPASKWRNSLKVKLIILLGDRDTDTQSAGLRRTPEAMNQGPHRLARGKTFFETGRAAAQQEGVQFGWQLHIVPGANHSNRSMAAAASQLLR